MLRISCPFCGLRDHTEFAYRGDATKTRPLQDAPLAQWVDFVYLRDNPMGPHREYWQHTLGCRAWVIVTRNTLTHEIFSTEMATGATGAVK
ncbi:MAG: sarcosine oxidase subunit delta [Candidimonas sp.]|nr:MAG: sarcosine oxidase subunit delta [Candidimonas sp.]TAM23018.1 MAG: sarcosine oxidase subunit delta [Candidimonas sp.]TAM79359.1 MAG: sarcosine oxidase subunit delta [Candidimonas sp.]